jgi:hypothetical protein
MRDNFADIVPWFHVKHAGELTSQLKLAGVHITNPANTGFFNVGLAAPSPANACGPAGPVRNTVCNSTVMMWGDPIRGDHDTEKKWEGERLEVYTTDKRTSVVWLYPFATGYSKIHHPALRYKLINDSSWMD